MQRAAAAAAATATAAAAAPTSLRVGFKHIRTSWRVVLYKMVALVLMQ